MRVENLHLYSHLIQNTQIPLLHQYIYTHNFSFKTFILTSFWLNKQCSLLRKLWLCFLFGTFLDLTMFLIQFINSQIWFRILQIFEVDVSNPNTNFPIIRSHKQSITFCLLFLASPSYSVLIQFDPLRSGHLPGLLSSNSPDTFFQASRES